ncbi:CalY family protein [Coriobacteriia bacterium Es71-Z0120]|uniref:TasA family protein n=1 Tax=Parvivirga hydrogeniphila TaxID=2939460 RepID=UPI00226095BD|nr:TasA family protein [Parvivirga hydrogeniphila]MCL4079255.1 CalY family protein [Parvivirga hydrogeniphila]
MKRRIVVAACAVALGFACLGGAGAFFTGRAEVPENVIRAGAVAVSAEPTSAALSIDALAPGGSCERVVTVANTGSLPSTVVVTGAKKAGITDFYNALTCEVTADGVPVYSGPLAELRTVPFEIAPGARARMTFAVGLPASAGNDLAGDYVKLTLYFDAEQVH